jgi:type IV secretory pathway VirB2 component (pilin)
MEANRVRTDLFVWRLRGALAVLAILLAAPAAYAQIAGGGGNTGLLSQVINWFTTNIAEGLIASGVLLVGCLLLFGRHTLAGIAVMVIGALVIGNYATIAGFFGVGG